jgi:acetyltransferase-like isoleucine patch superfamily enzyme
MNKNLYFCADKLKNLGFRKIGNNCKISKYIRTYKANITCGNFVRIDDDVILKGKIQIGSNVHLGRGCTLSGGKKGIFIGDFSTFSNFVQIFSISDNYRADALPSGTLNKKLTRKYCKLVESKILIGKGCLFGAMCLILPGAIIGNFSSFAAFSVIFKRIKKGIFYNKEIKLVKNLKRIESKFKSLQLEIKL